MKSFIYVCIFTTCFVLFALFTNNQINEFVRGYENKLNSIKVYIDNDEFSSANDEFNKLYESWSQDQYIWYKFFDHSNFYEIDANLKILESRLDDDNRFDAVETIEIIKLNFNNILEDTKLDFDYIF